MRFADPLFLFALLPLAALVWWDRRRRGGRASLGFSQGDLFPVRGVRARGAAVLPWLTVLGGGLLVLALARPQTGAAKVQVKSEGIDIILALDISGSMRAEDFKPNNRLYVAKEVAKKFVNGRSGDRIGLVVFSGGAYTQCPLTLDYGILLSLLDQVDFGQVPDGTAIGMAIATAVNRLRQSPGKSKVIILLTDGQNNAGEVDPITAAEAARAMGVKIYTIGAGTDGPARIPVDDPVFGRRYVTIDAKVDEDSLKKIASLTGGRYFRATTPEALEEIYEEIGHMEKTQAETVEYVQYDEKGPGLALAAALLLSVGMLLGETVGNRIP
jgi:Ca-activated chloride channel family protein